MGEDRGIRMFAAVRPPVEIRRDLAALLDRGRQECPDARWVRADQVHLTLAFWASVPIRAAAALQRSLAVASAEHSVFEVTLTGAATAPDLARARVVWLGVTGGASEFAMLAAAIRAAARGVGVESSRGRVTAHVTLARLRRPGDAAAVLRVAESFPAQSWRVSSFELVESTLDRGGAEHRTVATFALG